MTLRKAFITSFTISFTITFTITSVILYGCSPVSQETLDCAKEAQEAGPFKIVKCKKEKK